MWLLHIGKRWTHVIYILSFDSTLRHCNLDPTDRISIKIFPFPRHYDDASKWQHLNAEMLMISPLEDFFFRF